MANAAAAHNVLLTILSIQAASIVYSHSCNTHTCITDQSSQNAMKYSLYLPFIIALGTSVYYNACKK